MGRSATRSRRPAKPDLERLKLSPEVAWYLTDRGFVLPELWQVPLWKTPEPRAVEGARFDPARVDRVLAAFRRLRHTQGRWAGQALEPANWQVAYILAPVFGWVRWDDEAGCWVRVARIAHVDEPRKNGKGLYTAEVILTRDGWQKFGDLRVGDEVHALDGSLTRVTYVSPVRELDCYRVTFADGQSLICDADHLWTVWDRYGHDPVAWAESRKKGAWRTVTTPDLAETHRVGARGDTRYSVRMDRVIQRPAAELPIDPYLLGLWLGDGSTDAARITTVDPTIQEAFASRGYTVRRQPGTITYAINGGFLVALRKLGVLGNKHVPEPYLLADEQQRLALLRGLMDTDGSVIRGPNTPRVEFTSTKRVLADAVLFLARSLGWKATSKESRATLKGVDCGPRWRVSWTAFSDRPPFALSRKAGRLAAPSGRKTRSATNPIVSVERVPTVPTMCIQVAHPSHQFLAGKGLIPTHNTTLAGGTAMYLTAADGEPGAQVLAVAASKDQAQYCFRPVKMLAERSPDLAPYVKSYAGKIVHPASGSYFAVVASVGDLIHGANVHGAVVDELHVHKTPDVVDAVETGTGARSQPLIVFITTADEGKPGTVYSRKREYLEKLARGVFQDPTFYGVVWAAAESERDLADRGLDVFSEEALRRANPGYGVSPTKAYLASQAAVAKESPAELARYLRLHLGIRTKQATRFIRLEDWDGSAGTVDEAALAGRACHGGLDMGSVSDLTALCWVFPDRAADRYEALWRFWLPEAALPELDRRTAGYASAWVRQGWIATTPGAVFDPAAVNEQLDKDAQAFRIQTVGYDRWGANDVTRRAGEAGLTMVAVGQSFGSLSAPLKELLRLTLVGRFVNGGNPVARWMVDNLAVAMDPSGNVKPDKANSAEKIDGVSAAVNALKECMDAEAVEVPNPPATTRAPAAPQVNIFRPSGRLAI